MMVELLQAAVSRVDEKTYLRMPLMTSAYSPVCAAQSFARTSYVHQHCVAHHKAIECCLYECIVEAVADPLRGILDDAVERYECLFDNSSHGFAFANRQRSRESSGDSLAFREQSKLEIQDVTSQH
jgi:hypothetical protein